MTELQRTEIALFENKLVDAIIPSHFKSIVLSQRSIKRKFDKFEEFILGFMSDDGLVDGAKLNDFIEDTKPNLLKFISLPEEFFRLDKVIDEIIALFQGGLI